MATFVTLKFGDGSSLQIPLLRPSLQNLIDSVSQAKGIPPKRFFAKAADGPDPREVSTDEDLAALLAEAQRKGVAATILVWFSTTGEWAAVRWNKFIHSVRQPLYHHK